MPVLTIAQIISQKSVHDIMLNRMVPSIFDPASQGHKLSDRE